MDFDLKIIGKTSTSALKDILEDMEIKYLSVQSLETCLHKALAEDDPELLLVLIRFSDRLNFKKNGASVLHLAAEANALECIEVILTEKIVTNVCIHDSEGLCPAHIMSKKSNCIEGLALILEKMANVDLTNPAKQTCLHLASFSSKVENVELLLQHGASVDMQDQQGRTPLHSVAVGGCGQIAKILCQAGASVKTKDSTGATPFVLAIREGSVDVVRELFNQGIGVNEPVTSSRDYPIHLITETGNIQMLEMLLEKGANIESKNKKGRTALFKPACGGSANSVKVLLERGADLRALDKNGKSPLYCAVENCSYHFIAIVREYLNDDQKLLEASWNSKFQSALFVAVEADDGEAIDMLLRSFEPSAGHTVVPNKKLLDFPSVKYGGRGPLSESIRLGKPCAVNSLLFNGAHPCERDPNGFTPLHHLMLSGRKDFIAQMIKDIPYIDYNCTDFSLGCTPYALAAMASTDKPKLSKFPNVDVNAPDIYGNTSLHYATMLGRVELVKYLLSDGGNPNAKNKNGFTPMHTVFSKYDDDLPEYVDKFRNLDCSFEGLGDRLAEMITAMKMASLKAAPDNPQAKVNWANAEKRLVILKLLASAGGDVAARTNNKTTLVHMAVADCGIDDHIVEIVWILDQCQDGGRSMMRSAFDLDGFLPIHLAAELDCVTGVALMLNRGADITKKTRDGKQKTPLAVACTQKHLKGGATARILIGMGAKPSEVDDKCHTVQDLVSNGYLDEEFNF